MWKYAEKAKLNIYILSFTMLSFLLFYNFVGFFVQAKIEMDRLIASVGQKVPTHEGIKVDSR